jgi:hypothetical protein
MRWSHPTNPGALLAHSIEGLPDPTAWSRSDVVHPTLRRPTKDRFQPHAVALTWSFCGADVGERTSVSGRR